MKYSHKTAFCLSLVLSTLVTASVLAATSGTTPVPVAPNPNDVSLVAAFNAVPTNINVFGGVVFRNAKFDSSHFEQSIVSAFRITPNKNASNGLTGADIDRAEFVLNFSNNKNAVYAECVLRRAHNDDFDRFVSVELAVQQPNATKPENQIGTTQSASGSSRSFYTDSKAFSSDNSTFFYKANIGICNVNLGTGASGTSITGGIPVVQAGDTVDVYLINMNNPLSPIKVATGTLGSGKNIIE